MADIDQETNAKIAEYLDGAGNDPWLAWKDSALVLSVPVSEPSVV